jgi:hypothetical protein
MYCSQNVFSDHDLSPKNAVLCLRLTNQRHCTSRHFCYWLRTTQPDLDSRRCQQSRSEDLEHPQAATKTPNRLLDDRIARAVCGVEICEPICRGQPAMVTASAADSTNAPESLRLRPISATTSTSPSVNLRRDSRPIRRSAFSKHAA